jgi:hypothetical protein
MIYFGVLSGLKQKDPNSKLAVTSSVGISSGVGFYNKKPVCNTLILIHENNNNNNNIYSHNKNQRDALILKFI